MKLSYVLTRSIAMSLCVLFFFHTSMANHSTAFWNLKPAEHSVNPVWISLKISVFLDVVSAFNGECVVSAGADGSGIQWVQRCGWRRGSEGRHEGIRHRWASDHRHPHPTLQQPTSADIQVVHRGVWQGNNTFLQYNDYTGTHVIHLTLTKLLLFKHGRRQEFNILRE